MKLFLADYSKSSNEFTITTWTEQIEYDFQIQNVRKLIQGHYVILIFVTIQITCLRLENWRRLNNE